MTSNTPLDFFGRQRQLVKKYGKIPKQEFRKGVEDLLSNPYNDLFFFLDTLPGTVTPEDLIRGLTSTIKKSLDSEYNLKQQQWTQSLSFQYRFVLFWSVLAVVILSLSIVVYLKYLKSTKEDTKKTLGNVLAWTLFVVASSIVLIFLISFPLCRYVKSPFLSFFCSRSSWLSWLSMAILVFLVASFFSTWYFSRSFLKKDDSTSKTRMLWSGFLSVLFTVVYLGYNIYILVSTRSQISHSTSKKEKEIEEAAALLQQVKPRVGNLLQEGRSRYNAGSLARKIVLDPSKVYQILPSSLSDSEKSLVVQTAISMMEENKKKALVPLEVERDKLLQGPKMTQMEGYKERMSIYRRCLIFIGFYVVLFSAYYGINLYLVHKKVGKIDQYSPLRYISIVLSWLVMSLISLLLLYVFYNGVSNILNDTENFYSMLYIFTLPVFFFCLVLLLTSFFTLRYLGIHFSKTASTSTRSQKIAMIFSWMSFSLILISSIVMIVILRKKFSYYLTHGKAFFETSSKEETDVIRKEVTDLQQTKIKPLAKSFDDQIALLRSYLLNPTKPVPLVPSSSPLPPPPQPPLPAVVPSPRLSPPAPVPTPASTPAAATTPRSIPLPSPPPASTPAAATTPRSIPLPSPPPAPKPVPVSVPVPVPTQSSSVLRDIRKAASKFTGLHNVLPKNLFSNDGLMTMEEIEEKRRQQKLRQYYRGLQEKRNPSSSSSPQVAQRTSNDVKNPSSFVPLNVGKAAKTFGGSMMKAVASSIQL